MTAAGRNRTARVDPDAVRATLRAAGLRARHSLSQNFLADTDVLDAILAEADPAPGGRILEIGPGLGLLTAARSEEHTSELQSHVNLVCRLLLEKKKQVASDHAVKHERDLTFP